jgi:hypothetical protein
MLPSFLPNSMLNCETPTHCKKKNGGKYQFGQGNNKTLISNEPTRGKKVLGLVRE